MASSRHKTLFLAAGLQSGGTTLVSWCFLQRADMDGVLDLRPDVLDRLPRVSTTFAWAKATVASFRFAELAEFYRWYGYEIRPLLIVRDIRQVYASLSGKFYGIDGTTAEDPPLRMRLFRFLQDWEIFREESWPVLQYESLVADPEGALRKTCDSMGLPWDPAMLSWPKGRNEMADSSIGSQTFFASLNGGGALDSIARHSAAALPVNIPAEEEAWIAEHFEEYNRVHGYQQPEVTADQIGEYLGPDYRVTRRASETEELERGRRAQNRLRRVLDHPVLGRAVRYWGRYVNPGFKDVWGSD